MKAVPPISTAIISIIHTADFMFPFLGVNPLWGKLGMFIMEIFEDFLFIYQIMII